MKLKRLAINRLPGISQPFEIEAVDTGFHVVFGPNGIGKSSICRAVEGLYWEDLGPSKRTSLNGAFELDGETWLAEREGPRLQWQRGGENSRPPILPASHNHRCFFLRLQDLIDPSPDGTKDIASEIRRQMSGGFDLDQIASDLFTDMSTRHGRRERNDFNNASTAVQEAEGTQVGLQRRADDLDSLKQQLDTAKSDALRLASVVRALGLVGRLEEHAALSEEMAIMPDSLAKITGKEVGQIEQLQDQIGEFDERTRSLDAQIKVALEIRSESGLSAALIQSELAVWRDKADELGRVELTLQAARTEHSASRKELESSLSALGGSKVDEADLDLADHGQLFEFLRAIEAHKARVKAIEERLRLLKQVEQKEDIQSDIDNSRGAADALRSWLRAPEPETFSDRIRSRRSWLMLVFTLAAAGVALAIFIEPMFAALAALGAGIAVPVFMLRNFRVASGSRAAAQDTFDKFGIDGPASWDTPSVEARLRFLEGEIANFDARVQRARDRDVERKSYENELEGLAEADTALDTRRQSLTDVLNFDEIRFDAELVDTVRALDQLRSARAKDKGALGKVEDLEEQYRALLSELSDVLEGNGEPKPEDAKTTGAYLNNLADRNAQLVQAISDEERAIEQQEQVSVDRESAANFVRQIYVEASLEEGDQQGLTALQNTLPQYLDLKRAVERLDSQIELDRAELTKAGEAELAELDGPSLERLQGDFSQAEERAVELRDQIAETNAQVNEAKRGTSVQDLIAIREEARMSLMDRRDQALFAKAGKFLIDAVEEEYEQTQMPRVFERARDHFSAFTHHDYELRLGKEAKAPRLFAIELRSGEGRELNELSDGTRAQLLLAARIAFAEEVEQGGILPLFLDEALDQSDPERFEAIVRSLGRIASDQGRQIFYLTSDPLDVDRIRHALVEESCEISATIDLGLIRRNAVSVSGPNALQIDQRPAVLVPNGLSAEEYGAALGIPVMRPSLGYAEQHFFYVLMDDLDLLHDFLANSISRAGQWKTVAGTSLAEKLGSRSISAPEITARLDLLEVFCELWKQGRGRPVDREALEDSGALSKRYLDDVVEIASELAGAPEMLVGILDSGSDPRTKGLRRNSFVNLVQYLQENNYLDDQPVLVEDELRLLALASPAANNLPEGVASDCINRWWALTANLSEPET
jgi:DNA repair protein SbcC/Rad50